jgi:hypothetical protein
MKKVQAPVHLSESIEGIRLFRDDIEHLIETFRQQSLEVTLSDKDYEYSSLQELIDTKGLRPSYLRFKVARNDISLRGAEVWIEKARAWLTCDGEEPFRALWFELRAFLSERIPWHYRALNPWIWGLVASLLISADVQALADKNLGGKVPEWLHALVLGLIAIFLVALVHRRTNFGLILRRRHEGGFWKRNAERLLLLLLGAVLGAAVKAIVAWIAPGNAPAP